VKIDDRAESLGKKIREAEIGKVPYSLIIGEKEVESQTVTPRRRHQGDLEAMSGEAFVEMIRKEILERM
jgi:threonyl-tRNA synthetase